MAQTPEPVKPARAQEKEEKREDFERVLGGLPQVDPKRASDG